MLRDIDAALGFATSVLGEFDIDGKAHVEFVKYRENHVFKAVTDEKSYAVRIHRRHYRSNEELRSEAEYVARLGEAGMTVPKQRKTTSGQYFLVKTDNEGEDYQIDVTEWIDNAVPLDDTIQGFKGKSTLSEDDFFKLGQLAATLHKTTRQLLVRDIFKRQSWDGEGLIGKNALWGNPLRAFTEPAERQLMEKTNERILGELDNFSKNSDSYGPIHADFSQENILRKDGNFILIDFDDCGFGWNIFELTTALIFYQPHPLYQSYETALFKGYETILPIDERARELWPAFMLARGETYMGWAADRIGDEAANFLLAELKPLLIEKARQYLKV